MDVNVILSKKVSPNLTQPDLTSIHQYAHCSFGFCTSKTKERAKYSSKSITNKTKFAFLSSTTHTYTDYIQLLQLRITLWIGYSLQYLVVITAKVLIRLSRHQV